MKIAHLADLHFGIVVNRISMIHEQRTMMKQIIDILVKEQVDAVVIAGDVYDKSVPSIEATQLLDDFLDSLIDAKIPTYIIAGNHDNPDRLCYGARMFAKQNIFLVGNYEGKIANFTQSDDYGEVNFYLLPYIRPSYVNRYLEDDEKVSDYTQAVMKVVEKTHVDFSKRNVLLSHQFLEGGHYDPEGSEEIVVGGLDNISVDAYEGFDYVALGHLHHAQNINSERVRYSGTPIKYSFSEENQKKSLTIVELKEKGNLTVSQIPLKPLHEMRTIRGYYQDVVNQAMEDHNREDYVRFLFQDDVRVENAMQHMRSIYLNAMDLDYVNEINDNTNPINANMQKKMSPLQIFEKFYEERRNMELTEHQLEILSNYISSIWQEEEQ